MGYKVSKEGIKPLEEQVKAFIDFPRPKTIDQLRRFLGMINFYRACLPKAANYQAELNKYLLNSNKKDKSVIQWNENATKAFQECKESLQHSATLAHPHSDASVALMSDASNTCVRAVLQQYVNNSWQPFGYFSKKLSDTQQKYSTYDRELLFT